jgi:hypothetical protein
VSIHGVTGALFRGDGVIGELASAALVLALASIVARAGIRKVE